MIVFLVADEGSQDAAATAAADQLGLELHRVGLGEVTGKYIGETEKNISTLLSRAQEAGWMLLFDEADALFGKRTDDPEADDRLVTQLLNRLESHEDVVLLAAKPSRRHFGKHRGTCVNNLDPLLSGRIQVAVPDVAGLEAVWATPCVPFAGEGQGVSPLSALPPVGANVWVEFERGELALPIWVGGFWDAGSGPTVEPPAPAP